MTLQELTDEVARLRTRVSVLENTRWRGDKLTEGYDLVGWIQSGPDNIWRWQWVLKSGQTGQERCRKDAKWACFQAFLSSRSEPSLTTSSVICS